MWTGNGPRLRRSTIRFKEEFHKAPAVHVSISLLDADTQSAVRAELTAENVTDRGFDIVFRTWLDTRVARLRAAWMAIGELRHDDDWDVY